MDTSIGAVAKRLSLRAEAVCRELLPHGRKEGNVWKCGDVGGSKGDSMGVQLAGPKVGCWFDHATGQGGDLLKLVEENRRCSPVQAADWARAFMREPAWVPNGQAPARPSWDPWTQGYWTIRALGLRMLPTHVHVYRYANPTTPPDYVLRYEFDVPDENGVILRDKETIPWRLAFPGHKNSAGHTVAPGTYVPRGWRAPELRPIYGLDLLISAGEAASVLVVEGEKTCDAARKLFPDLTVITWPGGSKGANHVDWAVFKSHKGPIAIWPDNDKPGRDTALYIKALNPRAHIVMPPAGLPKGWDLADPIPDSVVFDPRGLIDLAFAPPDPAKVVPLPQVLPEDSDAHRATLLVDRFKDVIRYVHAWKRWVVFESDLNHPDRWHSRDDGGIIRHSRIMSCEIYARATSAEELKSATLFATASRVRAIEDFATADPRIILSPAAIDADPWLVGAPNGYIDLRTGLLAPHDTAHIITRFLGTNFDPYADCPTWLAFLERVVPDPAVRAYLQKLVGYSLSGFTNAHHFVFLHGLGANGKSTFLETLYAMFGAYALKAPERLLHCDDRTTTPPDVVAAIDGIRFLLGSETTEGARLNEGTVKDITGGDTLTGARKYEHGYSFKPVAKLWAFGNHKPSVRGTDEGIWRRMRLVHFPVQIPEAERDASLPAKLLAELPGILAWAVDGALAWQRDGLAIPKSIADDTREYREDEDPLGEFLAANVVAAPYSNLPHPALYSSYKKWAEESGIRHPLSNRTLANKLRDRGWVQKRTAASRNWSGFMLAPGSGQLPI